MLFLVLDSYSSSYSRSSSSYSCPSSEHKKLLHWVTCLPLLHLPPVPRGKRIGRQQTSVLVWRGLRPRACASRRSSSCIHSKQTPPRETSHDNKNKTRSFAVHQSKKKTNNENRERSLCQTLCVCVIVWIGISICRVYGTDDADSKFLAELSLCLLDLSLTL